MRKKRRGFKVWLQQWFLVGLRELSVAEQRYKAVMAVVGDGLVPGRSTSRLVLTADAPTNPKAARARRAARVSACRRRSGPPPDRSVPRQFRGAPVASPPAARASAAGPAPAHPERPASSADRCRTARPR